MFGVSFWRTLVLLIILGGHTGCRYAQWVPWPRREVAVLPASATRSQVVAHLNKNILGADSHSGLVAWQTSDARASMPGMPFSLPTSIAVEAPRSFRMRVSHPMSGNQEADIGSNSDIFWMWLKTPDNPPILTCAHEDVSLALDELQMGIPVNPEWLMEVFGVIPIDEAEYEMVRPDPTQPIVELIARRTLPTGATVNRVIRVHTVRGQIIEHQLRDEHGTVTASAELDNYRVHEGGIYMPQIIRLSWPAAGQEMRLELGHPDVNPAALAQNRELWHPPKIHGAQSIDIGAYARQARGLNRPNIEYASGVGSVSLPEQSADARSEGDQMNPWGHLDEQRPFTPVPPPSANRDQLDAPDPHPSVWSQPVQALPSDDGTPPWAR